eukprot:13746-Heterococcus_DN1.PRE.3
MNERYRSSKCPRYFTLNALDQSTAKTSKAAASLRDSRVAQRRGESAPASIGAAVASTGTVTAAVGASVVSSAVGAAAGQ